jgi:DNA-binding NtrC family response regulator
MEGDMPRFPDRILVLPSGGDCHGEPATLGESIPAFGAGFPPEHDHRSVECQSGASTASPKVASTTTDVNEASSWLPPAAENTICPGEEDATLQKTSAFAAAPVRPRFDRPRILVADDNADLRASVERLLSGQYEVTAVADGESALAEVRRQPPDLVISDILMPRVDGFELLRAIRSDPSASPIPVILLSAAGGEESKIEGWERGADDYLVKPFSARELTARLAAVLALARLRKEAAERKARAVVLAESERLKNHFEPDNVAFGEGIEQLSECSGIVGQSEAIVRALLQAEQVAGTHATVLIMGETGTGKELLARAIHARSSRNGRPMVTLNCAALPPTLVESELFGREKGAYTGALTQQAGRFELAHGSTLFLDEIGELPFEMQVKLLRVIQDGQFERLGGTRTLKVDVRIIAATNRDLEKRVRTREFREDLFYRLNVFPIRMPPLRDRREDIPQLVWAFVKEFQRSMGKPIAAIPRPAMEALEQHEWPGNVRELRNVIERAMILSHGPTLRIELPSTPKAPTTEELAEDLSLQEVERRHILAVLRKTRWRVSGQRGAAKLLGLKPTTLESRMSKLGIMRQR